MTAVLFTAGPQLIGLYLGQSSVASSDGAPGSVMILLLRVYYSCQIVLFGAEFTRVYAERHGVTPPPESFAEKDRSPDADERVQHEYDRMHGRPRSARHRNDPRRPANGSDGFTSSSGATAAGARLSPTAEKEPSATEQQHDHDDDEQGVVIHDGDSIGRP